MDWWLAGGLRCFQLDEVERKYFDESKRRVEEVLFKLVVRINRKS